MISAKNQGIRHHMIVGEILVKTGYTLTWLQLIFLLNRLKLSLCTDISYFLSVFRLKKEIRDTTVHWLTGTNSV